MGFKEEKSDTKQMETSSATTETTYEHLKLYPFDLVSIKDIHIKKEINEHGRMYITGIIPSEIKDEYINIATPELGVGLISTKDEEKILFCGVISDIEVKTYGDNYELVLECLTGSYLMDTLIKKRSFQDINKRYSDIIRGITYEYQKGDVGITVEDQVTNEFIIQYKETDWQFIKRMASRFNEGLYPSFEYDSAKYFFGQPNIDNGVIIDEKVYNTKKHLNDFRYMSSNYIKGITTLDFIEYKIESFKLLDLGEKVKYDDLDFYVKYVEVKLIDGILRSTYRICTKNGLKQPYFENPLLKGAVGGNILDIQKDRVKVHIDEIEGYQDIETAYWFPYQAMYASEDGSGWYCMPEKGDSVMIQFPNDDEKNAFASSSVSKYQSDDPDPKKDRMGDPNIRFIKNPQGMEVTLTPSSVVITSNNKATIILDDTGVITMTSKKEINMKADKDISITSKEKINLTASKKITFKSGEKATLELTDAGIIKVQGEEVYTN